MAQVAHEQIKNCIQDLIDSTTATRREYESRLRKFGIYTQRPVEDGFFMVRVRIPGGDLSPRQLQVIANLADQHGRGLADLTVRQNIQFHWVRLESLAGLLDGLQAIGLSTVEAGGGSVRNIMNCPASGVEESELYDTTKIVQQVNHYFAESREFSDLPRKFKITITGCAQRCVYPEINDIGIFAVPDGSSVAFRARIGGGLSTSPRFSKDLGVLVQPEDVVQLCAAIATVFRDRHNCQVHGRVRLEYLVEDSEISGFREEVEGRLGRRLRLATEPNAEPVAKRDRSHLGIHRQRQDGHYYVGIVILGGRTSGQELRRLALLAEMFGSGRIRTTNTQNIMLLDIPESNLLALKRELQSGGFNYEPSWSSKAVIACTGIQFCKLAMTETKNRASELNSYLEKSVALDDPIRISITGCPNSCGQHHICDVGLEGSLTTINGIKNETFQVLLGGGVGRHETFSRKIGVRIPSEELSESMVRLFTRYTKARIEGENFQHFCLRHSDEELTDFLLHEKGANSKPTIAETLPMS